MTRCRPLSVITATPPGFNPGMLASQIAARWFLRRHQLDRDASFLRLIPITDRLAHLDPVERSACLERVDDGIRYEPLLRADQLVGTTPLYWGDLLHMRHYLQSIRRLLTPSQDAPEDLLLLHNSAMEDVRRAVSFGTSFLYHTAGDLRADDYGPLFRRFIANARLVMPRDIVSLAQVAAVVPQTTPSLGLDPTQLFSGGASWREAFPGGTDAPLVPADTVLCYFARGRHDVADLSRAIALFSRGFGLPARWLPWGDRLSFPHLDRYASLLEAAGDASDRPPSVSALLESLAATRCVLTDTYHVFVIAWSLGTPALLIRGDYWPGDYNSVVDKRRVFCVQHGLQEFWLDDARDHARLAAFIDRGIGLLSEGSAMRWYRETVGQRVEQVEKTLAEALQEGEGHA